jgi:hypothetical protein
LRSVEIFKQSRGQARRHRPHDLQRLVSIERNLGIANLKKAARMPALPGIAAQAGRVKQTGRPQIKNHCIKAREFWLSSTGFRLKA